MKLYTKVSLYFLIWLISLLAIFFFAYSNFPQSGKFSADFWQSLANWDGGHYLNIAERGYSEKFQFAFFPLYPLATALVAKFTNNFVLAGLLVSILSTYLAMNLLYQLVRADFGLKAAQNVVLIILTFPTAFFLITVYSESLFLVLVLASFYFLRRGNLILATIFATLASATRLAGLALVLALWIEVFNKEKINQKNWFTLLAPLGFLSYCLFLYSQTQNPFYFVEAQKDWLRQTVYPAISFWETIRHLSTSGFIQDNFNVFLDLLFATFGLGMVFRSFRFLPLSYSFYGLFSIILPLLTPTLSSMPRFLLPIFPIFILVHLWQNKYLIFAYQMISLLLLSAFAILFHRGYWIS